jgi:biopolymer transport protein ExbD
MKIKTDAEADVNITSLIDCLMQCIIFFMVIMTAQYTFGVAIKFAGAGSEGKGPGKKEKVEKNIVVYVQADQIEANHVLVRDGILKLNGEDIGLTYSENHSKWDQERKTAFEYLGGKIAELISAGYNKDQLIIQGDMLAYHGKVMAVIDQAKANKIAGFTLVPAN